MMSIDLDGLPFWPLVIVLGVGVALLQYTVSLRRWPSAPGPRLAAFTSWWYLFKVSQGKFETWNRHQHAQHGKLLRVAPGMYSVSDPASIHAIYGVSSLMTKSNWYKAFGDPRVPNHNLFNTTDRTVHAGMRRKVAHFYSMTTISRYEPYVDSCTRLLLAQFDRIAETAEAFDLQRWMQCYAFDVIGEITFGARNGFLESGGRDIDGIMAALDNGNSFATFVGIEKLGAPFCFLFYGSPVRGLNEWVRRASLQRAQSTYDQQGVGQDAPDFFSKLQTEREKSPEDYQRHRMETIMASNVAAGSDTTSISLTAALFYMATTGSIFNKLRAEIVEAEQASRVSSPITFEQAQKLPYLQAVIKEALRLWPATGLPMWRVVAKPGATIAGQHFPPGAIVGVNSWVAHRDPIVFAPDPDAFRPERWLECGREQLKIMDRSYMPFGLGTRTCIGKNISILEMSKVLPELVKRYNFTVFSKEMQYTNHWFVKPKNVLAKIERV